MSAAHQDQHANQEQVELWNGTAGQAWVEEQQLLDMAFAAFEQELSGWVEARGARDVLDVGCGTGATTLAIARHQPRARCIGVDVSQPMLAVARERALREGSHARFVHADAQTHAFSPGEFDAVVSRFGVMFFADPAAAFANLRRATRAGGALRVIVFRSPAENAFMTTAERAVGALLPHLPPRKPDAPGQFAFADRARVARILAEGGWGHIEITPLDVPCAFPAGDLPRYFTRFGPVGMALRQADDATRAAVSGNLATAFEPYLAGGSVRFTAACWAVGARSTD
jgi:SAM-dependent methyltransferase